MSIFAAVSTLFVGIVKGRETMNNPVPAIPATAPKGLAMNRSAKGKSSPVSFCLGPSFQRKDYTDHGENEQNDQKFFHFFLPPSFKYTLS